MDGRIWESLIMATGTWERKHGKWKPQGISTENEPEPLRPSGILLYFEGTELRALALQDGDKLYDDKVWHLVRRQKSGEKTWPLGQRLGAALITDLACKVAFRYMLDGTELELSGPLATLFNSLAEFKDGFWAYPGDKAPTPLIKFSISINMKTTTFAQRSGTSWVATMSEKIEVPGSLVLPAEDIPVDAEWVWNGRITGYFTVDSSQSSTTLKQEAVSSRRAGEAIGLVFSDDPPESVSFNDWRLTRFGNLQFTLMSTNEELVSLKQYVEVDRRGLGRWNHPRRAVRVRVEKPPKWEWPNQLFAVEERNRLVPSLKGNASAWGFGPVDPLFVGSGSRENLKVRVVSVTGKGLSLEGRDVENLSQNYLPVNFKANQSLYLVIDAKGNYGPFVTAADIPAGTWTPLDASNAGEKLVSWRGFVDSAELVELSGPSGSRSWLRLKTGFALKQDLWSAAPFCGLAMYPESVDKGPTLWGTLHDYDESFLRLDEPGRWSVTGQWLAIDPDNRTVEEMAAFAPYEIDQPLYLVLFNNRSVERVSGAVLRIDTGTTFTCPTLVGWLTDTEGSVDGLVSPVDLNASTRCYRLKKGRDDETGIPADIRSAFDAALNDKQNGEGSLGAIHWRRLPNQDIEARADPRHSGVFEHIPSRRPR